MSSISKRDLVKRISKNSDCKQYVVRDIVQNFLDEMIKELGSGNRLEFREFGIFQPKVHQPRTGRNPRTGNRVNVPAHAVIRFKPGRKIQELTESMSQQVLDKVISENAKRIRKPKKDAGR